MVEEAHVLATAAQHAHERRALQLLEHPTVVEARARVAARWLELEDVGQAQRNRFAGSLEELVMSAAVWASNRDPQRPDVVVTTRLEHQLDGRRVPGSRWGFDDPDAVSRCVPVDARERYEVRGRLAAQGAAGLRFALVDERWATQAVLSGDDLVVDDDGTFVLVVDAEPAGARRNHLRSVPGVQELHVRDLLVDWATDDPCRLEVVRLGPAATGAPPPIAHLAELAAERIVDLSAAACWRSQVLRGAGNTMDVRPGSLRGLDAGPIALGCAFWLEEDEAIVVRVDDGGAGHLGLALYDVWGRSYDHDAEPGSRNGAQAVADDDGRWTFVISALDPGRPTWLWPDESGAGVALLRLERFLDGRPAPSFSVSLDRLSWMEDVDTDAPKVGWREREAELEERARWYRRRLPEAGGTP